MSTNPIIAMYKLLAEQIQNSADGLRVQIEAAKDNTELSESLSGKPNEDTIGLDTFEQESPKITGSCLHILQMAQARLLRRPFRKKNKNPPCQP